MMLKQFGWWTCLMVFAVVLAAVADPAAGAIDPSINPTPTAPGTSGTISGTAGPVSTSIGTFGIGANFTGTSIGQSGFIPPDTMGAVGPNHVMELINGRAAFYQKDGTFLSGQSLNSFWSAAGVSPSGSFAFDPRVVYDPSSGRFFAASVDNAGGANNILVAVSDSSDPTAGWTGLKVDADTDNKEWADFPMLGVNGDRVTISANMFGISGAGGTSGVSFLVIPKSDLTAAAPTVANATLFEGVSPSTTGFSAQPILDLDFNNGSQQVLSAYNKPAGLLKTSSITGGPASPVLSTSGGFISVTARSSPPDIDQPGTKTHVDAGDNRFSGNVVQQHIAGRTNASLWGVHGVSIGGRAAIEWYEIDAVTQAVLQSGTIGDDTLAFNYSSIAVNDDGDVVIGFSGGDPSTFISTYAMIGLTESGVTSFSDPILTKAGTHDYQRLDGIGRNRWGDYSSTVLDPSDPTGKTFWTFQEFVSAEDVWSIQITEIIVPEPATLAVVLVGTVWVIGRRRPLS